MPDTMKRRYNRVPFEETCCAFLRDGESDLLAGCFSILDLGPGGVSIESDRPFTLGEEVTMRFGEEGSLQTDEKGVVTHCISREHGQYRVGINFLKERALQDDAEPER